MADVLTRNIGNKLDAIQLRNLRRLRLMLVAASVTMVIFLIYFLGGIQACKDAGGVWDGLKCVPKLLLVQ